MMEELESRITPTALPFTPQTIDANFDGAYSVHAADGDGDGDLDVLGTAFEADDITWWENLGGQFALTTTDTAPPTLT